MDPVMQQKCDRKLLELQECMPFLLTVLKRLRNNNRNDTARQIQLEKIQKLYNLLNDKTQTFKWDLLVKCENVIKKLQRKMELQGDIEHIKSNSPVEEKNRIAIKTLNQMNREDLSCPESPPPLQIDDFNNTQPVVIPTERCCSPPISSKHRETHKPVREHQISERKEQKHHHRNHHHHHHHQHGHPRQKQYESSSYGSSRDDSFYKRRDSISFDKQESQKEIIDQYLYTQRRLEEENRQNIFQRRNQNVDICTTEANWAYEQTKEMSLDPKQRLSTITTQQPSTKSPNNMSVFERLGEKIKDSESSHDIERQFRNFQNTQEKYSNLVKPHSISRESSLTSAEISPIIPDLLKSPPLSANDITQLLNESNTNSNSCEPLGISEIGTRRTTSKNVDSNASLDMVRKKFAMLTKTSEVPTIASPTQNDVTFLGKSFISPNSTKILETTPKNVQTHTTSIPPTERIALKYHPHSRSTVGKSLISNLEKTPPLIVPNSNVNVLPTLRPNDPRLRKTNITNNGNTSAFPSSNNCSILASQPSSSSSVLTKTHHIASPISNASVTSTPSPIYGSSHTNSLSFTKTSTNKNTVNDPRLQRSHSNLALRTVSIQKQPLVTGDSSDENWDLDDNANGIVFPPPRPFLNRNPTGNVNLQSGIHHSSNAHGTVLPPRRQSMCWESGLSVTNNTIVGPNRVPNNLNTQGSFLNVEDPNIYQHTNRHTGASSVASILQHYNVNSTDPLSYSIPRTYGAYKEARARAAAAEHSTRKADKDAQAPKATIQTEQTADISANSDAKLSASSSLDTTYRNTNLSNCELPKTMEFKIPKKTLLNQSSVKTDSRLELENGEELKANKSTTPPKTMNKSSPPESNAESPIHQLTSSTSPSLNEKITDSLQPKSQRERFSKRNKDSAISNLSKETSKLKAECDNLKISYDENDLNTNITEAKLPNENLKEAETTKIDFHNRPCRILKRRCTMIDKSSAPEVDKEKLEKVNAMLFEDLQEQERKKRSEEENGLQAATPNRRHGEICYEKTDDGCTVSTQNIITGKRRTRTTANFNEVQQGIAVFKHMKLSEQKKDITPSLTTLALSTKDRKKPGPKPKSKTNVNMLQEKVVLENPSKIKKRRKTLVDSEDKLKTQKEEVKDENTLDAIPNVASIFDTFIQKILNPSTNADELIDKLRDILSQQEVEVLLSVRKSMLKKDLAQQHTNESDEAHEAFKVNAIVEKPLITNEPSEAKIIENLSDTGNCDKKETSIESKSLKMKDTPQAEGTHMRPKAPRRNELDRLHDDIRDMFISEGVLTATGKRMRTFVDPGSTKMSELQPNQTNIESGEPPSVASSIRMRKTRVILPTLKIAPAVTRRSLRKTQPLIPDTEKQSEKEDDVSEDFADKDSNKNSPDNSCDTETAQFLFSTGATLSTTSSTSADAAILSSSTCTKSDNEPLCSVNCKPVRLREEDELDKGQPKQKTPIAIVAIDSKNEKAKPKRYKPCPKSKKPAGAFLDDSDDEDDADVEDSMSDVEILGERPKIKEELLDVDVPYENISTSTNDSKSPPKNINPKWHWLSRYAHRCVVCKKKACFISLHYKKYHAENYVSRVSPIILKQLKQQSESINKPMLHFKTKKSSIWLFRCPFCLQFKHTSSVGWLEHFITHTGEYFYECTLCHSSCNKSAAIEHHMKQKCASLGGRYLHNDELNRSLKNTDLQAHVCHLCNFLSLGRGNLERHYTEQHDYDIKDINDSLGYAVSLMNLENIPTTKSLEELTKKEQILNQTYQTEIILLSEEDDEDYEKPKEISVTKPEKQASDNSKKVAETSLSSKKKTVVPSNAKEKSSDEKLGKKKSTPKAQNVTENGNSGTKPTNSKSKSLNTTTLHKAKDTSVTILKAPVSSAFMSTTDDSNYGETSSILTKKLFTVDETDLCNRSPSKLRLGAISMAERLSQRLKEVESNTSNDSSKPKPKEVEIIAPISHEQKKTKESTPITNTTITQIAEHQKLGEDCSPIAPTLQQSKKAEEIASITLGITAIAPVQSEQHSTTELEPVNNSTQSETKESVTKERHSAESKDKSDVEIDLTIEEDDDDWEDIEIVETAPNAVTVAKSQKVKAHPLQKLSRFYSSSKSYKKTQNFKPLMSILSGVNGTSKESNQTTNEATKKSVAKNKESDLNTSQSSVPIESVLTTSAPVVEFSPTIASASGLLPESSNSDSIVPEPASCGPLQELSDITTLLDSNLNNLMDIDVEDPANSICIHNTDNQQTSIQEALNLVASTTADYEISQTTTRNNKLLSLNGTNDDGLVVAPNGIRRIQNIGYTCSAETTKEATSTAFKFYCFSDRCTFLYSSEAIGLENHFLLEHPHSKWNGYCNTCASQIEAVKSSLQLTFSDEFHHLLSVHVKLGKVSNQKSSTPLHEPIAPPNESNSSTSSEQPRIKLRRLSGDCLSSAIIQNESLRSTFLDTYDDSNSFSDLIRLNQFVPAPIHCLSNDVPFFTNVSKDFEITSISSGLEPTELSAIVKSALNVERPLSNTANSTSSGNVIIPSVVSLNDVSSTDMPEAEIASITATSASNKKSLPIITNVCSLKSNLTSKEDDGLWLQQTSPEIFDLTQSAGNSRILGNSRSETSLEDNSPPHRSNNDSPGPMIVSETLPAGQATSGDFVITQTVSAQYAEESTNGCTTKPKLGFNISISSTTTANAVTSTPTPTTSASTENKESLSKTNSSLKLTLSCMDPSCKFTTRHFVGIIEHIRWHEKKNDVSQQEYLRCSICQQKLLTVDAYTQHLRHTHYSGAVNPTIIVGESSTSAAPIESCTLTKRIRNILNHNQVEITGKDSTVVTLNDNRDDVSKNSTQNFNKESLGVETRLLQTIKEMVAKTGLSDNKLFRCMVKDCIVKLNENSYHTHVLYHLSTLGNMNNTFPCPHCKTKCQSVSALKKHIKSHGRHTLFCYVCMETAVNDAQMAKHFAQKHWYKKDLKTTVLEHEESNDASGDTTFYYVTNLTQLTESNIRDFSTKLIIEWQRKKAAKRTHFNPDEMELLPIQAIFSKEIYCALCLYKTKVRTNMVRHMSQHKNTSTGLENIKDGSVNASANSPNDGLTNNNILPCSMDPVNPVPCLISKERHFDRMTNLASSSLVTYNTSGPSGGGAVGGTNNNINSLAICKLRHTYIPQSKRFKCGIPGCDYLTICEDVFRSHLNSLHSEARSYKCLFCNEELCKRSLVVEKIVQHLRFHDRRIYQCENCSYSHYMRYIIDRHALEKHGSVPRANILVFIRDDEGSLEGSRKVVVAYSKKAKDLNSTGTISEDNQKKASEKIFAPIAVNSAASLAEKTVQKCPKFICNICDFKTITYNQLISHSNSLHGFKQPYQCDYCKHFTAWSEQHVGTHIAEKHPGEELKINRLFGKMNPAQQLKAKREFLQQQRQSNLSELPPKPLWQRDDPRRARQIRGIPMEDEEDSERLRKRLRLSEDYYDEDDYENAAENASGTASNQLSSLYLNRFEFGCFYCEYKTTCIDDLRDTHWETIHSKMDGLSSKPFLFRLLIRLRCVECENFIGCFWELQKHMADDHLKPTSQALDPRAKTFVCGYCEYDCSNATQLLRHHLRDEHQPQDLKGLTSVEMAKVMRLECNSSTNYVHCSLCSELFNSRLAVVQHAGEKHGDNTEQFSFRELRNKTIYRCSECTYASTDELTTLRHMINHYKRFKRCNFCYKPQATFNDYMQHCYSDHRAEIKRFSEIYPLNDIRKYLMQVLIIFPNGWIINKKNLRITPYGNEERIKTLYAEICKTSQEPPIPRLSLGRLVARKSIEAKQQQQQQQQQELTSMTSTAAAMQLAGNAVTISKKQLSAQKISKRRSTIAVGNDDSGLYEIGAKKQKLSNHIVTNRTVSVPLPPKFKSATEKTNNVFSEELESTLKPYSYYGQRPDAEDWSKLHTKISIAGINTPISMDKFKILVRIDAHVVLEKLDISKYRLPRTTSNNQELVVEAKSDISTCHANSSNQYKHVKKACPASQKYRFT